jgi:hypothetical protein
VTPRRLQPRWIAWLLATAFIAIQAIALAHELKHDLRQHDDASCVLHLQTKSGGGNSPAAELLAPVQIGAGTLPSTDTAFDLSFRISF